MSNILIVDDNEDVRRNIANSLKDKHTVLQAGNGKEAEKILKTNDIDLIFIDIVMPGKSGVEFLMESKFSLKDTKIIIITGNISSESQEFVNLTKTLGVDKILYKPFKKEELFNAITEVMS